MIGQLDDVRDQTRLRKLIRTGNLRLAVSAHVDAYHTKVARQMRHPRMEAGRASHRGVNEYDGFDRTPRIGIVVQRVRDLETVGCPEFVHAHCRINAPGA